MKGNDRGAIRFKEKHAEMEHERSRSWETVTRQSCHDADMVVLVLVQNEYLGREKRKRGRRRRRRSTQRNEKSSLSRDLSPSCASRKSVAVAVTESQRNQTVQDSSFASKIIFRLRVPRSFRAAISPLIVQPAISVQDLRTIGETFSRRSCLFVACTRLFLHVRRAVGQRLHQPSAERTSPSRQPVIAYTTRITYVLLISERSPRKKRTRSGQALDHPRIPASQNRFVAKLDTDVPRRCPISA
ncbi:hypothetical protein HN011_009169 [Eciton burchellii]|nr:hypothetical protein HN011_009169 [Eciton burchellii]